MVFSVRPQKEDPNRTRITIGGNHICCPGDVGTPTASLELFKLVVNSVLSQLGAQYATFDIKNFYLGTPLDWPKYVRIRLSDLPQEFKDKYDLDSCTRGVWVYFKIRMGVYGLPWAVILAKNLLRKLLGTAEYYEAATTPGLWLQKWCLIMFSLIVDDFSMEYVEERHAKHLLSAL